jgi:hypothetical protein
MNTMIVYKINVFGYPPPSDQFCQLYLYENKLLFSWDLLSFMVKFGVKLHQFHVFQTFVHRLLRQNNHSPPRIFILSGTSNISWFSFFFISFNSAWYMYNFQVQKIICMQLGMISSIYIIWKLQTSRCRHLRYANWQIAPQLWLCTF